MTAARKRETFLTPKPWTSSQKDLLQRLAADGVLWPEIAQRCGHPKSSCQSTLSFIRRQKKRAAGLEAGEQPAHRKVAPIVFQQAPTMPAPEPSAGVRRISTLVSDAELRARIAILGPNGLLGDPLPGRSALDQKLKHGAGGLPAPVVADVPTASRQASASRSTPAHDADAIFSGGAP